ncbi:hypothetical protein [Neoactinobaculum massilliense]|uniref:hypothetical protein n=1 Tax=Neoactinobaculum massilliense TaxID=2364794 RepID=UPI000F53A2B6|nr:hypothetical protein [Neoactinobaculum massilliense]
MKLFSRDPLTFFGIPVGVDAVVDPTVDLGLFQPENPSLLVPRTLGAGWDLNVGALAVKLGLIRPDDSLEDLEEYIPARTGRVLAVAPWAGAAVVAVVACMVGSSSKQLPKGWTPTIRPKAAASSWSSLLPAVLGSAGLAAWNGWRRSSSQRVDAPGSALAVATDAAMASDLVARCLAAHGSTRSARLLAFITPAIVPVILTGTLVGTVKSALTNLDHQLRKASVQNPMGPTDLTDFAKPASPHS